MRGKRLLQSNMHDWFIQEAFDGYHKNARGKKSSSNKANLKAASRRIRYNKDYKNEIDNEY